MADYNHYTDQELISSLHIGDERILVEIYNRYWDKLLAVAVNRLGNQEEAEECVQDIFLSLWFRRQNLTIKHTLSTYLGAMVKYQIIKRLDKRYAKRTRATTTWIDEPTVPSPEAYTLERELMERIEATVQQLPEKCQMVYRMSREQGKSHKEIADELSISQKTVEGHITRALTDIRTNLNTVVPAILINALLDRLH